MSVTTKLPATAVPGLPRDYRLLAQEEEADRIRYTAECTTIPKACPYCGGKPRSWGSKERTYMDFPRAGKRVEILVVIKRMRCPACKKTFLQDLPAFNHIHGLTRRYFLDAAEKCYTHTFGQMGEELGIEDTSARLLFHTYLKELESCVRISAPEALALVPLKVVNKPRTALINAKAKTLVDLLASQEDKVLEPKLMELAAEGAARFVAIGFNKTVRKTIKAHLPGSILYVDPFFVLEMADLALEQTRKAVRKPLKITLKRYLSHDAEVLAKADTDLSEADRAQMNYWFALYPVLGEAYQAREAFRQAYRPGITTDEAFAQMSSAVAELSPKVRTHFRSLSGALKDFEPEIRAFFTSGARDFSLADLPELGSLGDWIDAIPERGKVFEIARASALYPSRMPGATFRTPGTSIARLRDEALKKASG